MGQQIYPQDPCMVYVGKYNIPYMDPMGYIAYLRFCMGFAKRKNISKNAIPVAAAPLGARYWCRFRPHRTALRGEGVSGGEGEGLAMVQ